MRSIGKEQQAQREPRHGGACAPRMHQQPHLPTLSSHVRMRVLATPLAPYKYSGAATLGLFRRGAAVGECFGAGALCLNPFALISLFLLLSGCCGVSMTVKAPAACGCLQERSGARCLLVRGLQCAPGPADPSKNQLRAHTFSLYSMKCLLGCCYCIWSFGQRKSRHRRYELCE